jgi:hypothetical protein
MAAMNLPRTDPNDRFILVKVVNRGYSKTTIGNLAFIHFERKPNRTFTVPPPTFQAVVYDPSLGLNYAHPTSLGHGDEWIGFARQTKEVEGMARNGYLYAQVYHTMGDGKPISERVIIRDESLVSVVRASRE